MKIRTPYIFLFLSFVVLGVYYPSLFAPLNSVDDGRMINTLLNIDQISFREIFFPGGGAQYYRPLLFLTFIFDKFAWGLEESFMHLENILLHLFNVWMVFLIASRIHQGSSEGKKGVAFAAALLFALHPLNTEAVNWISGRTDVLAGSCILLSLLLLLRSLESPVRSTALLAALFYLLGCLAKESAVFFLPGALLLLFSTTPGTGRNNSLRRLISTRWFSFLAFCLVPVVYLFFRHNALRQGDSGIKLAVTHAVGDSHNFWDNIMVMVKVAGFYARKLFIPMPLNFGIITVPALYLIPGVLLMLFAVYWLWKRDVIAGLFFSATSIGSAALIVAIAKMSWTPVAERYMYMPCAIFSAAIMVVAWRFVGRFRLSAPFRALPVLVLVLFAWVTVERNILWQDNLALAEDTSRKSPAFAPARNDIAVELLKRGKKEQALEIFKSNSVGSFQAASMNRAVAMVEEGNLKGAREMLLKKLEEPSPYHDQVLNRLITVDEMIREASSDPQERRSTNLEIIELLKKLHGITGDPFCYYRMGRVALLVGSKAEAGRYFSEAWKAAPDGAYYKAPAGKLARDLTAAAEAVKSESIGN